MMFLVRLKCTLITCEIFWGRIPLPLPAGPGFGGDLPPWREVGDACYGCSFRQFYRLRKVSLHTVGCGASYFLESRKRGGTEQNPCLVLIFRQEDHEPTSQYM